MIPCKIQEYKKRQKQPGENSEYQDMRRNKDRNGDIRSQKYDGIDGHIGRIRRDPYRSLILPKHKEARKTLKRCITDNIMSPPG